MTDLSALPAASGAVPSALREAGSTALPAAVRAGSAEDRRRYAAALGFEQVMLRQLVQDMVPEDSGLAAGPYGDAVQDAFAQGIAGAGGVGLAQTLFQAMQETSR